MAQFYHTRETNNLDGDLSITISHIHMYTHIHTNVLFVLQIAHHHTYIYVCIYLFHHTELSICLTTRALKQAHDQTVISNINEVMSPIFSTRQDVLV